MTGPAQSPGPARVGLLDRIADPDQAWEAVRVHYGVANPVPPWKSSLDGTCDALDRGTVALLPLERRNEEDELSRSLYAHMPYPESQLLALAHWLVMRGVLSEDELARRLETVRARLEAA